MPETHLGKPLIDTLNGRLRRMIASVKDARWRHLKTARRHRGWQAWRLVHTTTVVVRFLL
jgi:hypothetical protein